MENLKQIYNSSTTDEYNPFTDMGEEIVKNINDFGLGVLPKSDLEGLIFHCICNVIEDKYADNINELDYVLMQILRISPAKLRSLRITRSAKYLNNLDYKNTKQNIKRIFNALRNAPIDNEDIYNGKIKISVSDPHTQNLIERIVEENRGVIDHSTNSKLLILNANQFLKLIAIIIGDGDQISEDTIQAIKDEAKDLHGEITKENILKKFQEAFQEHALGKIIEFSLKVAGNIVENKIGLR